KTLVFSPLDQSQAVAEALGTLKSSILKQEIQVEILKNTYGDGYRISLVCDLGNERRIIDLMSQIAPSSKLIDESGGSMVFSVPLHNSSEIG
ncbi:MAG: hypothetical protein ACKO96_40145, partial [Flammeovirgaceae bacterium]